jgi:protein gp37
VPEKLNEPRRWKHPKKVFVNSMSDLFHLDIPDEYVLQVAHVMEEVPRHTYQVLTKRSERMRDMLGTSLRFAADLPHVWWGVSVEDKKYGLPRVEHLRAAPAKVRFLSVEPLLEDLGELDLTGIHWVIAGGESGRKPRPMEAEWVRSVRDQCQPQGVAFFFKQWGGTNKKAAGREIDGRTWDEMPGRFPLPTVT